MSDTGKPLWQIEEKYIEACPRCMKKAYGPMWVFNKKADLYHADMMICANCGHMVNIDRIILERENNK